MASTPWPKLAFAQRSDPGRDPAKQVNEDAAHYQETALGHLLVVCDGMGGHASGREASNLAISVIAREVSSAPPTANAGEVLRTAVVNAGRQVFALGGIDNNPSRPGSTCVALLMHPGGTEVAHIGDSRAYLLRKGHLWALTRDHSMVQQMVDNGLLRPEEAATHPDSNKITRALGMRPDSDVELRLEPMLQEPRDLFLLITDGVSDVVPDADLKAMAAAAAESGNVEGFCEQVIALSNARGGPDNCTIQAAFVVEPGLDQERVRLRAPVPTQVDLEGPPFPLDHLATPIPSVSAQQPGAVAPALERGPQRTMPLTPAPSNLGSAPQPGVQPPATSGAQPLGALPPGAQPFGAQPFGAQPPGAQPTGPQAPPGPPQPVVQPAALFGAPPAQPQGPPRRGGATIPFELTLSNGLPAAPALGAPSQDSAPPKAQQPVGPQPGAPLLGGPQPVGPQPVGPQPGAPPPVAPHAPAHAPAPPQPQPRRRGWVIFGLALFVIGAAIVAAVAWYLSHIDEAPQPLPEAPVPTESTSASVTATPAPVPVPVPVPVPPHASAHAAPPRGGGTPTPPPSVRAPPKATPPTSLTPAPPPTKPR